MQNSHNKRPGFDIVREVLDECVLAYPVSSFVISLYKQYGERGSLSKKQLQGIYGKASRISTLPPGKLATLEALINKMPTRYKSEVPGQKQIEEKENIAGKLIADILKHYPQHKRVLFYRSKHDNNEPLSPAELTELEKFARLLKN